MRRADTTAPKSKVTVPAHCHPAAKIVFAEMRRQGVTYDELEFRSGVLRSTIKAWRTSNTPNLDTLAATLGALGWEFLPVPPADALSPVVLDSIVRLAETHGLDDDAILVQLVREVAGRVLIVGNSRRKRPEGGPQ